MKFIIQVVLLIAAYSTSYAQLFVNEVSQGTGGNPPNEYVELIVVGTPTCNDTCLDIRGWIIDDNNGFYGSSGIAGGHLRFSNNPQWQCVPYGSIILIYNDAAPFPGIVMDETDANNDLIYALPPNSNLLESNSTVPGNSSPISSYAGASYSAGSGNWNMLAMKNTGDAILVVNPSNLSTAFFSVGWSTNISGTNYYIPGDATNLTLFMANTVNNDPFNSSNWTGVASIGGTPGQANNTSNANWISSMRNRNLSPISQDTLILCVGDSVNVNGNWVKTDYMYNDTLQAAGGCDSIVMNEIKFLNQSQVTRDTIKVCFNDSVLINGNWIKNNYTYSDTFNTALCDSIVIHHVEFELNKQVQIIGDEMFCSDTKSVLFVENNFQSYLWSSGSNNYLINIEQEGTYSVKATDNNGCVFEDEFTVTEKDCYNVCIPFVSNSFTPNGDGINDKFAPSFSEACNLIEYEFGIYNKWGKEIFKCIETTDYWDGNVNQKLAPLGLYIWKLKYRLVDEVEYHEKIGVITIVQ